MGPRLPSALVVVWTAPRCVSTAFERCIMEIPNGQVLHEPFTSAYYFGPERTSRRYDSEEAVEAHTYAAVSATVTKKYYEKDYVFVKDMAYCVKGRFDMFLEDEQWAPFKHTLLIRNPTKAILSLYKASLNSELTGWDYFDEAEAGFTDLHELYETLTDAGQHIVIVDCDDLLTDPDGMMKSYCDATGLTYREGMTSWEAGPQPDWNVWNGWHDDALKSTGFKRKSKQHDKAAVGAQAQEDIPQEVQAAIDTAMVAYEKLHARRLLPTPAVSAEC